MWYPRLLFAIQPSREPTVTKAKEGRTIDVNADLTRASLPNEGPRNSLFNWKGIQKTRRLRMKKS